MASQSSDIAVPRRSRRPETTKAGQRAASMDLLLQAALRLFVSQGYRSTNLEQISGAAQLTKGAVYFYFGSKEAVLLELLRGVKHIVVDDAIAEVDRAGGSAANRLIAYIHYQANLGITHRDEVLLLILMSLEFKERDGEVPVFIRELYSRQRDFIDGLIEEGQRGGDFRTDVPVREMAAIVLAINDGTFLEWFRRSDHLSGVDLTRALRTTILNGIIIPPGSPPVAAPKAARAAKPARVPARKG
jgi:AcrR family transcriptional regulator